MNSSRLMGSSLLTGGLLPRPPPPPPPPPAGSPGPRAGSTIPSSGSTPTKPLLHHSRSLPGRVGISATTSGFEGLSAGAPTLLGSSSSSASSSAASLKAIVAGGTSGTSSGAIPRSSSARGGLQGVEMEKPENMQGKQAPKVVLVKRSSLQRPPPPHASGTQAAAAAAGNTKATSLVPKPPAKGVVGLTSTTTATPAKLLSGMSADTTTAGIGIGLGVISSGIHPSTINNNDGQAATTGGAFTGGLLRGPSTPADIPAATVTFSSLSPIDTSPCSLPIYPPANDAITRPLAALIGINDGPKVPQWVAQATAWSIGDPSMMGSIATHHGGGTTSSPDNILSPPSMEKIIDEAGLSEAWEGAGHLASGNSSLGGGGGGLTANLGVAFSSPLGGFSSQPGSFAPSNSPYDSSMNRGGLSPDTSLGLALMPSESSLGLSMDGSSSMGLGASRLSMRSTSLPSEELLASLQHIWGSAGAEEGGSSGSGTIPTMGTTTTASTAVAGQGLTLPPVASTLLTPQLPRESLLGLPTTPTIVGGVGAEWGKLSGGDGGGPWGAFGPLNRAAAGSSSTIGETRSSRIGTSGSLADLGFEESCEVE